MNRQVPEQITIVGNGKMAKHMVHYFELVGQPYTQWFRNSKPSLATPSNRRSKLARFKQRFKQFISGQTDSLSSQIKHSQVVLLLIPDDQVEPFIQSHPELNDKTRVHFSGSLVSDIALGCHPLMTFGEDLYDLERYQSIPFVVDSQLSFKKVFPLFNNQVHCIEAKYKSRYHAMCVIAGNFPQMMWQAVNEEMAHMNLPKDLMSEYLKQNTENFVNNPKGSITGPFSRGDLKTIANHQKSLEQHPLGELYHAFRKYQQHNTESPIRSQL